MKFIIRVPLKEYAFLEAEIDDTAEEAVSVYEHLQMLVSDKEGLNTRDWCQFRKRFVNTGKILPEEFEKLSKIQRYFVHQLKLALKDNGDSDDDD